MGPGTWFFFARPDHSWERGLRQHTEGLVREYFPKSTDSPLAHAEEIRWVERRLNRWPRKVLGWRAPEEAFLQALRAVGEGAEWESLPLTHKFTRNLACSG